MRTETVKLNYNKVEKVHVADLVSLCQSETFMSGACPIIRKEFVLGDRIEMAWEIRPVDEYFSAIDASKLDEEFTAWQVLHETYIENMNGACGVLHSFSCGSFCETEDEVYDALEAVLLNHPKLMNLAEFLAPLGRADANRLYLQSLGSMPLTHFDFIGKLRSTMRAVCIPLVEVLLDAYRCGLLPFGMISQKIAPNYLGPPIVLCLDPQKVMSPSTTGTDTMPITP